PAPSSVVATACFLLSTRVRPTTLCASKTESFRSTTTTLVASPASVPRLLVPKIPIAAQLFPAARTVSSIPSFHSPSLDRHYPQPCSPQVAPHLRSMAPQSSEAKVSTALTRTSF